MRRWVSCILAFGLLAAFSASALAQTDLQQRLKDTGIGKHWIYDDVPRALAQAKTSNKPVLALFR